MGGSAYQNLGVNTMYGAVAAAAVPSADGEAGCLGMVPSGSNPTTGKGKGNGKGKGKAGKGLAALHPNGQLKLGKKPKKPLCCNYNYKHDTHSLSLSLSLTLSRLSLSLSLSRLSLSFSVSESSCPCLF